MKKTKARARMEDAQMDIFRSKLGWPVSKADFSDPHQVRAIRESNANLLNARLSEIRDMLQRRLHILSDAVSSGVSNWLDFIENAFVSVFCATVN